MLRRFLMHSALALGGLTIGLTAAEIKVRLLPPDSRTQIVRESRTVTLDERDGVPVWWTQVAVESRQNLGCLERAPDAPRVMFFGSSIFYGSGVDGEDVFTNQLQSRRPDLCLMNRAQPGFTFEAKAATAREWIERYEPDLVFFEVWRNDPNHFTRLGGALYNLAPLRVGPDGYPDTLPTPPGLNRLLFHWSRLYEHAALSLAAPAGRSGDPRADVASGLVEIASLARASGASLVAVICPWLDRPFEASLTSDAEDYAPILEATSTAGIPVISLAEGLAGQDVERLRLDPCCHFNPDGHARLSELFGEELERRGFPAP